MATKLHGRLNLSRIPKNLIQETTDRDGNPIKVLWVDVVPRKGGADQFGNTHSLQVYDSTTRTTHYLADFKPQEFGNGGQQAPAAAAPEAQAGNDDNDLPF